MSQVSNSKILPLLSERKTRKNSEKYLKIINELLLKGKMSINEMADSIGIVRNSVYLYTHLLEKVGLIEKFPERTDRKGRPYIYFRPTKKAIDA